MDWGADVCTSDLRSALELVGFEGERDREAPVRGPLRLVVAVRPEIAAGPRVVAADDVALHPRDRELEGLGDLRHEPPPDPCLGGRTDLRLLDHVILPPLVAVVDDEHGPAPVVADEARLLSDRKSTRLNSSH